jgi:orotate phosphoribosyltransferase-like protein
MKKIYKTTFLTILFIASVFAANAQEPLEDVINGIRSANIPAISKYFDKFVTITINNNQSVYSNTQGEMVLKDFFAKNPAKEFTVMQQGATSGGNDSKYAIGNLVTAGGSFRIYVVLKHKENIYILQEIRFEK